MIYVFVPYYQDDAKEFTNSLAKQSVPFELIRRNRKRDKIYWTRACNDFYKDIQKYRGLKDDDVVCIMNNDIIFSAHFIEEGSKVKQGEVYLPEYFCIYWKTKSFNAHRFEFVTKDSFAGRAFFMTYKDFRNSGGFSKLLPHHFADIDFGIRQIKRGLKPILMKNEIHHIEHPNNEDKPFMIISPNNPFIWTIFLLKHFNRYTFINIIKAWVSALRLLKQQHVTRSTLTVQDGI